MTISEAKRITRMNEWKQLIHERQQSGQSVRAWCLQNGIRENSYYYWLRIIREEALCEAENKSGALVRAPMNVPADFYARSTAAVPSPIVTA